MTESVIIEEAAPADLPVVLDLLREARLPVAGLPADATSVLVARSAGALAGTAAVEWYPDGALLRSVAVAPEHRGTGLGIRLTKAALDLAASRRVPAVYLLTETAGGFFPRFGFRPIPRSAVPAGVLGSVEFTSACPASALVMKLALP